MEGLPGVWWLLTCVFIQRISNSASFQACSELCMLVEHASVHKLQRGWSLCLHNKMSARTVELLGALCLRCAGQEAQSSRDASLCGHCLVLALFQALQMHQQTQLCKSASCLLGKLVTESLCNQLYLHRLLNLHLN